MSKKFFFSKIVNKLNKATFKKVSELTLKNAKLNIKFLKKSYSIESIKNFNFNKSKSCIIVGAGPSLKLNNQTKVLKKYQNKFVIIACDGSLYYLLRNNIIPDLVVTLDPHPTRIVRWFGDENLKANQLKKDDYFKRQEMDDAFYNEIKANKKIIELFDKFSDKLNIAISSSSSKSVVHRLVNSSANLYWWNPFLDDPKNKNSTTRKLYNINKLPIINSLGNVASAAWMMADNVLMMNKIALIGMDFGYYENTPFHKTQYYDGLKKICKEEKELKLFFKKIYNPKLKKFFFTDFVYYAYKQYLLEALKLSSSITYNCTGGGILFGKNLKNTSLDKFCKSNLNLV